ncbi:MAG: CHASE domain-containing protein [Bdellovibrionales bacterium]
MGLYILAGYIGVSLASLQHQTTPVWPATGIAMSCLFIWGLRVGFGVFLGSIFFSLKMGLPLGPTLFVSLGHTVEASVAVLLFHYFLRRPEPFGPQGRLIFSILAVFFTSAINSLWGTATLYLFSMIEVHEVYSHMITRWVGGTLGALFLVPIAYKISQKSFELRGLSWLQYVKLLGLWVVTFLLTNFVFSTGFGETFFFFLFVPLLFAVWWFNSSWGYLISLFICGWAIWQTSKGQGPFVTGNLNESLMHLQLFLASLALTAVGLGLMKSEGLRKRSALVLMLGWILSGVSFYFFSVMAHEKDTIFFQHQVEEAEDRIRTRFKEHVDLLEAGASFFDATPFISDENWHRFTHRIVTDPDFHGLHGLGVIFKSSSTMPSEFRHEVGLRDRLENFRIHSVPGLSGDEKVARPESNFVITYVEPKKRNQPAIGLNVATERRRLKAAELARDTGQAVMTEPVTLVQDERKRPGFLLFFPIYKKNSDLSSLEARRRAHFGFIYAPIIAEQFFRSTSLNSEQALSLKVEALIPGESPSLLFRSQGAYDSVRYSTRRTLNFGGVPLLFEWTAHQILASSSSLLASWLGFSGAMCSLLLALMLANFENLTERAQRIANEKSQEALQRRRIWQTLAETSPVGIYLMDQQELCTYVNPTWTQLTGLTLPEAMGNGWERAVHPEDRELVQREWNKMRTEGRFTASFRYLNPNDGKVRYVQGQAVPLVNENGESSGYLGTVQDVTDLHLQQAALISSSRLSSLGEMASGVAHEINNPLTIIIGKARKIEAMIDPIEIEREAIQVQAQQIVKTAHRISKIIKGLQAFARETTNEPFEPVLVQDLLQNTLELCRERFTKNHTELIVQSPSNLALKFFGREEQISQVLMNLLNNSFDAVQNSPEKWVKIEVTTEGARLRIAVTDSGPGVKPDIEQKIYDPFFTTKEIGKGTGLGLSISKGIVERHRGKLYYDSSSKHTRFVVELDVLQADSTAVQGA